MQLRYQPWEHAIIQCNLSKKKACKIAREVGGPLHPTPPPCEHLKCNPTSGPRRPRWLRLDPKSKRFHPPGFPRALLLTWALAAQVILGAVANATTNHGLNKDKLIVGTPRRLV